MLRTSATSKRHRQRAGLEHEREILRGLQIASLAHRDLTAGADRAVDDGRHAHDDLVEHDGHVVVRRACAVSRWKRRPPSLFSVNSTTVPSSGTLVRLRVGEILTRDDRPLVEQVEEAVRLVRRSPSSRCRSGRPCPAAAPPAPSGESKKQLERIVAACARTTNWPGICPARISLEIGPPVRPSVALSAFVLSPFALSALRAPRRSFARCPCRS